MFYYCSKFKSDIGEINLAATDEALIYCGNPRQSGVTMKEWIEKYLPDYSFKEGKNEVLVEAESQLKSYFKGELKALDVPLKLVGTDFRQEVWKALREIPYGETKTYGEVARMIGNPKAARAVGQANNKNPISYFVP